MFVTFLEVSECREGSTCWRPLPPAHHLQSVMLMCPTTVVPITFHRIPLHQGLTNPSPEIMLVSLTGLTFLSANELAVISLA